MLENRDLCYFNSEETDICVILTLKKHSIVLTLNEIEQRSRALFNFNFWRNRAFVIVTLQETECFVILSNFCVQTSC